MKKYFTVARLTLERLAEYRLHFLVGELHALVIFLILGFFWIAAAGGQNLGGYSAAQILSYVLLANLLRNLVLIGRADSIAFDIVEGQLTNILIKPTNYFLHYFWMNNATRFHHLWQSIIRTALLAIVFIKFKPFVQSNPRYLVPFVLAILLACIIYQLLDFIFGILAFWTYRAYGPRFALSQIITFFSSGIVFPLDLLPQSARAVLSLTPFPHLIFTPIKIFLGQMSLTDVGLAILNMIFWVVLLGAFASMIWQRGLRRYEAVGI